MAVAEWSLTSSAFAVGGTIPGRHTCDGEDRSPPLSWSVLAGVLVSEPIGPTPWLWPRCPCPCCAAKIHLEGWSLTLTSPNRL